MEICTGTCIFAFDKFSTRIRPCMGFELIMIALAIVYIALINFSRIWSLVGFELTISESQSRSTNYPAGQNRQDVSDWHHMQLLNLEFHKADYNAHAIWNLTRLNTMHTLDIEGF